MPASSHREIEPLRPGTKVDTYTVRRALESSHPDDRVYLAWHARLQRHVELRFLGAAADSTIETHPTASPDAASSEGHPRSGLEMARTLAQIDHPNIATIYDVGRYDDQVYVASERVDGRTLEQWISLRSHTAHATLHMFERIASAFETLDDTGFTVPRFSPAAITLDVHNEPRASSFQLRGPRDTLDVDGIRSALRQAWEHTSQRWRVGSLPRWLTATSPTTVGEAGEDPTRGAASIHTLHQELRSTTLRRSRVHPLAVIAGAGVALIAALGTWQWQTSDPVSRELSPPTGSTPGLDQIPTQVPTWVRHRVEQLVEPATLERLQDSFEPALRAKLEDGEWLWRLGLVSANDCKNPRWSEARREGDTYFVEAPCIDDRTLIVRILVAPDPPHRIAGLTHFSRPPPHELVAVQQELQLWINDTNYDHPTAFYASPLPQWSDARREQHETAKAVRRTEIANIATSAAPCAVAPLTPDKRVPFFVLEVSCANSEWLGSINFGFTAGATQPGPRAGTMFLNRR